MPRAKSVGPSPTGAGGGTASGLTAINGITATVAAPAVAKNFTLLPAPQRLARRLVMMAEGYGQWTAEGQSRRVIAISQEQLSLMLAISRQTTNQILKDLESRQLVRVQRGELEILDLAALRAACS